MVKVCGVKFKGAGKIYYFDPGNLNLILGDDVIVETARGIEYGTVAMEVSLVDESDVVQPLKPVIRVANEDDKKQHEENLAKKEHSLAVCQEKIDKRGLEMKLVDVEYTFDNSKVIFYFTADGRVDFRDLVKDLASAFRIRIELRQIGVRDETKMMGGIGCCGRPLCCATWLHEFAPVSIKMAKVQNLSLNPTKISGICGRLMCCLQYENETYISLKKGMPDVGEHITTRDGKAVVYDVNIFENEIKTRLILDEKGSADGSEKLSSEFYIYGKEEITRSSKKRSSDKVRKEENREAEATEEELKALED